MAYRQKAFVPIKKIPNIKNNSFLNCKINIKWYNIKDSLPFISDRSREYNFYRLWKLKEGKKVKIRYDDTSLTCTQTVIYRFYFTNKHNTRTCSVSNYNEEHDTSSCMMYAYYKD
jgi:hypothetical protein